jgi:hypothetical protein
VPHDLPSGAIAAEEDINTIPLELMNPPERSSEQESTKWADGLGVKSSVLASHPRSMSAGTGIETFLRTIVPALKGGFSLG